MMNMKAVAVFLLLGVVSAISFAASNSGPVNAYRRLATPLAKMDTTVSRSFTIPGLLGYGLVSVYLWHEDHSSLTKVEMDCTVAYLSHDYVAQDCESIVAGTCKSVDADWYKDLTGTKLWPWRVDVMGFERLDCTLTFTGGSAGDSIQVDAAMMTQ